MSKRYSCGTIVPSQCVPFTGKKPAFVKGDVDCDANLNDIIDLIGNAIDKLQNATDVSAINKRCLELPAGSDLKALTQVSIDKICGVEASLNALKTAFENLKIGNEKITIDLKCLKSVAAPCESGTNTYTLSAILNTLVNEICNIKTLLEI